VLGLSMRLPRLLPLSLLVVLPACGLFSNNGDFGEPDYASEASTNLKRGDEALDGSQYQLAEKYFEYVKTKFPFLEASRQAELRLADVSFERELWTEAADRYTAFVKLHPTYSKVDYAAYRAAVPVAGAPPFLPKSLRFDRFAVSVDGDRAAVVATLDASGMSGAVQVSSLGRERIRFVRRGGRWELDGALAPSLSEALAALWRRAEVLSGSSPEALAPLLDPADRARSLDDARLLPVLHLPLHHWEPRAWFLRSERAEVLVTEEAALTSPTRPPEPRTGRLRLVPSTDAGSFVFAGALL